MFCSDFFVDSLQFVMDLLYNYFRQNRIILSADTVSEVRQMLSQKRRQYFVYWRAFWQRRCRAAAAGAVLKPSGGNCAVLPFIRQCILSMRQGTACGVSKAG